MLVGRRAGVIDGAGGPTRPATPTSLRTERLLLRPWRLTDREPFAALNADPKVMEHFPGTPSRADSDALVDRIEAHFAEHGWGLWATEVVVPEVTASGRDTQRQPESAAFIGFIGLSRPAHMPEVVEVGWRLARAHWGRGYAPEGAAAALEFAFDVLGLDEVVSFTTEGNARSRRVMEKLGLHHAPERDFDHSNVDPTQYPDLVHHVMYVIDRDQWHGSRWSVPVTPR